MNCIFCSIIEKKIPAQVLYEDEHSIAFLDAHPHSKGHTLIIPKKHYSHVLEMEPTEAAQFALSIHKAAKVVSDNTRTTDMNITTNIGALAGQVIFHAHVHLIPRYNKETV